MSKFCSNCGKEINDNSEFCLGCGVAVGKQQNNANNKNKKFPVWLIVVLVILGIGVVGAVFGGDTEVEENSNSSNETATNNNQNNNSDSANNNTTTTKKEKLSLEDGHYGYSDDYGFAYYIEGYINNNTNKDYSYVQVSFTAYDAEGNTIGSCYDNNGGLQANGRWKFKAMCSGEAEEITRYELDEITGW